MPLGWSWTLSFYILAWVNHLCVFKCSSHANKSQRYYSAQTPMLSSRLPLLIFLVWQAGRLTGTTKLIYQTWVFLAYSQRPLSSATVTTLELLDSFLWRGTVTTPCPDLKLLCFFLLSTKRKWVPFCTPTSNSLLGHLCTPWLWQSTVIWSLGK